MRTCAVILLIFTCATNAQELSSITAQWTQVIAQEDGTPIDPDDLIYAIMDGDVMQEMCVTSDTTCTFTVGYGECGSLYAVAYQLSTGLESAPSNVIDVCVDGFSSRLNSPYLEIAENGI